MWIGDRLASLRRLFGRGVYPPEFAWLLLLPLRRLIISPGELADRLSLSSWDRVLEIGPGPGYFSVEVARRVPDGHLELVDLQPGMLERARRRLERAGITNASLGAGDAASLPYASATFDVVFLVTVLGEIADRERAAGELGRVLRAGGRLSITESAGDPDRLSTSDLTALMEPRGFRFVDSVGGLRARTVSFIRA
jgi:ubiquinone/menaquinone biosynthesis C-methylase UbiE